MDSGKVRPGAGSAGGGGGSSRTASDAALSGRLVAISLFDVCQFLMLNRKTGTLTVRSPTGTAYFTFQDGQLLTALNDALRDGDEVIMQAVQWTDGTFEFVAGPVPTDRRIHVSTENILLEVARRIDEMQAAAGESGAAPSSQETAFRERQQRAGALSEAFRQAVAPGGGTPAPGNWRQAIIAGLVEGSTDRILLGPQGKICILASSGLQTLEGIPDGEILGWIEEMIPAPVPPRRGSSGRRRNKTVAVRSWLGPGGVRLWGERFRSPEGDWAVLCHPRGSLPLWEGLGPPAPDAAELEAQAAGGLLILGPTGLSLRVAAALLAKAAKDRPAIGWVVECYPAYDWSVLPGRVRSVHPSFLSEPGALSEILEASRAEILVFVDIRQGWLLAEAFRAAAEGVRTIVLDRAASWDAWLRRIDPQGLRPEERPSGLARCLHGLWTVREGQSRGQILLERLVAPGPVPDRVRAPGAPSAPSPVR